MSGSRTKLARSERARDMESVRQAVARLRELRDRMAIRRAGLKKLTRAEVVDAVNAGRDRTLAGEN